MKNFFKDCKDITEASKLHRELMKEHHPDVGGNTETAQSINDQFDIFTLHNFTHFKETNFRYDGKRYDFSEVHFSEVVSKIIHLNVDIEQVGYWLWVRNWDDAAKKVLTDLGFWKSGKHDCFIYNGGFGGTKRKRTRMSMNQIRNRHGSMTIEQQRKKEEEQRKKLRIA